LTKNWIIGYNIRRKLDGLQPKVYAMAAATTTFVHKDTHAHDCVDDVILDERDDDHDLFKYAVDISDGGEDDGAYDVNALHPDSEEQMPSSPELLVSVLPGSSHERISLEKASARIDASLTHTPCTDVFLPVALDGNPQWMPRRLQA
jgi:hypothetical protein